MKFPGRMHYDGLKVKILKGRTNMANAIFGLALLLVFLCRLEGADQRAKKVDALLKGLIAERAPGVAVLVAKDGRAIYNSSRGVADMQAMRPIDFRTDFRLASVTKQFTAAAIMLLVRDGKLRYEDRLTDLFPDFPEYGRAITIRNLLDHTSGLPDYEELMPAYDRSVPVEAAQIQDAGVMDLLKRQKAGWFVPGSLWRYSNSGYVLLGLIVEKASGRPFPDFLQERIFTPLNMINTLAYVRGKNKVPNRAFGYAKENDRWNMADQSPTSATLGDGGIYSSLADLLQWDEALRRHSLLSEAEMRPALTPVRVPSKGPTGPDGAPADYGFGWFLNGWKGHPRMWHYGETIGFRTAIQRFTDEGLTVVVLSNRADLDAAALSLDVAGIYLEGKR
ncbi:MAG: serine hydrolase [Candidatus Aminicenantes bacterium]|nr:serine hydrolase [Candidatus Aminicenantes bacterium]